jgi:hypothetical protein
MPIALIALCNAALGLMVAWLCDAELRASPRGPWQSAGARALIAHELLVVAPMTGWWLWRAPDWCASYWFNATRAPSLVLAAVVVLVALAAVAGFAVGARVTTAHRGEWTPRAAGALAALGLAGVAIARARFSVVTSYVHFRGGLGPTPGERVSSPWWAALALLVWALAAAALATALRSRTRALTLRNRG